MSRQLAHWLWWQHPELRGLAHFDFGSGVKLAISQARRQKALNPHRGFPDLFIAYPIFYQQFMVAGYFLELKRDGTRLQKRDGSWASEHIAEQAAMLERLRSAGYAADFGVGLEECIRLIEDYLAPIKAKDVTRPVFGTPEVEPELDGVF